MRSSKPSSERQISCGVIRSDIHSCDAKRHTHTHCTLHVRLMWLSVLLPRFVKRWFCALCKECKHIVLDYAHPVPHHVVLYPGRAGGVHNAIMTEVLHFLATTGDIVELDALLGDDEVDLPTLRYVEGSTDGECDSRAIVGCTTVVRFLGRHWHEYPLHPNNAARMDAALELLEAFLTPWTNDGHVFGDDPVAFESHVRTFVARLEREQLFEYDDEYLGGFARATLADACWGATFRWLLQSAPHLRQNVLETNEFPHVSSWCQTLFEDDQDEGSDDDTASSSEDEGKDLRTSVGETTVSKKEE